MSMLTKFQQGLKKTSSFFSSNLISVLSSKKISQETLDDIESILITSDIGLEVTDHLTKKIKSSGIANAEDTNSIFKILSDELESILKPREKLLFSTEDKKPTIIIFIGVNGCGKTTTIGKLLNKISKEKSILVGACDTFRAAAVEQLKEWTLKENVSFYQGEIGQDPASVAFTALQKALKENFDYLIVDTAGRLSNNTNLLNQLIKIKKVINKEIDPQHVKTILVLDGTNGSNMIKQVEIFSKSLDVSGLVITKIDGTAKGGALISVAKKYEIPIHFVGLGEKVDDLHEFNSHNYVQSMLGLNS